MIQLQLGQKSPWLIVADNVLWDGTVLEPEDHKAQAIADFNKMVAEDERVEQVLLPVRDGVNIIRKLWVVYFSFDPNKSLNWNITPK